ncbi:MAG: cbb3-type cytochrome c oxidase subunit II [Piscinibacter sp.]|uniref:cbb3-type cytochrome c oxidase subunit II n=1 Tax=Piscinibacter sp. TaxID=1903157 RepID=UPI001B678696|nr:cbb3-type cytochrome c oxidase subunit II [Piscinibacter sp.]MBP5988712.1 cbb3-type cytochrome c oxidase subunit II [Piscinibacter sp.]MBP6025799.1 cbb3-type cytochrome c oxidase subunit II [Piscinibacter sp.]
MNSEIRLLSGAMVMLALATSALVVLPYLEVHDAPPLPGLKPYGSAELRGRAVYIANGCVYCHSQQPRAKAFAPDFARGWGRATVAGDYAYDQPQLLGTMRTGPDLMNIGVRQPSEQWHLGHLYQPRAFVPGSIMPSYPFLFEAKAQAEKGDVIVNLPALAAPAGRVVVARPEAVDLVRYLQSLDRSYPVLAAPATTP